MKLLYRPQFSEEWLPAEATGPAISILISALLRLDYEVVVWDGDEWMDPLDLESLDEDA